MLEHMSWVLPAAKELYKQRDDIARAWDRVAAVLLGRKYMIAFTGIGGAGKTVLQQHLTGAAGMDFQPPNLSRTIESGRMLNRRFRLNSLVIPGQSSLSARIDGLNQAFGTTPADGILHIVCGGYTVRSRTLTGVTTAEPDLDRFIQDELAQEVEGIDEICDRLRASIRQSQKPRWLLVGVTKCDLFYDQLEQYRDFYLTNPDSPFVGRLRRLQAQVGSDNFAWSALPVCAWLEDFGWGADVVPSQLDIGQRNHYLANFAEAIDQTVTAYGK